ncbi:MAG: metallophosphoesterase [Giesbergeria sp.]|uniref:metallophosphoesterase n=1 Tax=Giesbergeria sp. TaxID=2818473 RepID=UPI00262267DD|nr:metallophosphoesterase [Giesbergeria sp.]MDD2608782.1 metallophosphoesterase [Giesbergeria sp.]
MRRHLYHLGLGWCLLAAPLALWDMQGRWAEPERGMVVAFKLWLFWAAWALLPWLLALWPKLRQGATSTGQRWLHCSGLVVLAVAAWAALLEPRLLALHTHRLAVLPAGATPLRLALVSDIHVGLFVRAWQLERLVELLNAQAVDAVVVAGDWTYAPPLDLQATLAPLARIRHPVWAVLGNHDTQSPGPALTLALRAALQSHGVHLLDGQMLRFKGWDIVGLSDLWGGNPHADIVRCLPPPPLARPRLVLAHQPDTAALLPADAATLVLSGHTHGGQIRLPWITQQRVLPGISAHGWYAGHYSTPAGALFVSTGVGTIGLPARLGVIPRVDVLQLH